MSQKVSLRLNVKLPSAGLNGQLQRADESVIDNVHEKANPPTPKPDSRQTSPTSSRRSHSARSAKQVSPAVRRRENCIKESKQRCHFFVCRHHPVCMLNIYIYIYIAVFLKCKSSILKQL